MIRFTFRQRQAAAFILSVVGLCMLVGCEQKRDIVGKWRLSGSAETTWEFARNGSVVVGNVQGRYRFGDQGRIKVETPFATSVYILEIAGDRMTLREPGGPKLEFTRVTQK